MPQTDIKTFAADDVIALAIGKVLKPGREGRNSSASIIRHVCGLEEDIGGTGRFAEFAAGFLRERISALIQLDTARLYSGIDSASTETDRWNVGKAWLKEEKNRLNIPDAIEVISISATNPPDVQRQTTLKEALALGQH